MFAFDKNLFQLSCIKDLLIFSFLKAQTVQNKHWFVVKRPAGERLLRTKVFDSDGAPLRPQQLSAGHAQHIERERGARVRGQIDRRTDHLLAMGLRVE